MVTTKYSYMFLIFKEDRKIKIRSDISPNCQIIVVRYSLRDILVKKRSRGDSQTALAGLRDRLLAVDALVHQVPLDERTNQK